MSSPENRPSGQTGAGKPPLVVIVGPTAVGKTELSIQLAERVGGEIISADSRLFYRGMDIGTAKPGQADRQRVPHHLIDIADPDETVGLAVFQRCAQRCIIKIHSRGHLPFLVGGTGQYVRAVYQGWNIPAQRADSELRQVLFEWGQIIGPRELHARLRVIDPPAAAKIEPNNLRRTIRALEVIFLTGERFSNLRTRTQQSPYDVLILGLTRPRAEVYARIDARIQQMLVDGWLGEVRTLLDAGYAPDLPAMSAIGYQQLADVVLGKRELDESIAEIKRLTHHFVRRQANWFKPDDPQIHWFPADEGVLNQMEALIRVRFRHHPTKL